MAPPTAGSKVRALARAQRGVIAARQLRSLGSSRDAIRHRIETVRLFVVYRGVYAVGRPELTQQGRWMAAVLACGTRAVLSHQTAAALWEIQTSGPPFVALSVPPRTHRRYPGIRIHRRALPSTDLTGHDGIPV